MTWILIRHGMTRGNLERRYIGMRTDEPLCPQGVAQLRAKAYPPVRRVFASPMARCLETARMIYPGIPLEVVGDFRECDFGAFENLNHDALNGRADYQAWIDSGGELPFPGGESRAAFADRCVRAFERLRRRGIREDCAIVAHGGTIMAVMARYARPAGSYFDYQVPNGEGFLLRPDGAYARI